MVRLKKRLGQYLLADARALGRIAQAAGAGPEDVVLEIGPGTGNLTARLLEDAGRVIAVEIDREMCARLTERFKGEARFELLNTDILAVDFAAIAVRVPPGSRMVAVGNLPYYITAPILLRLLENARLFSRIVVLVQEEVARRITAAPGSREFGAFSVACQARAHCTMGPLVTRQSFRPVPAVDSAVVRLATQPPPDYGIKDLAVFEKVVRGAFEHRRKTCYNSLRFSLEKGFMKDFSGMIMAKSLNEAFQRAGVPPGSRPQTIAVRQFALLAAQFTGPGAQKR